MNVKLKQLFTNSPENAFYFQPIRKTHEMDEHLQVGKTWLWKIKKESEFNYILEDVASGLISILVPKTACYKYK